MSIYGHVDGINGAMIGGWLVNKDSLEDRCVVVAYCGDHAVAEAKADIFREDLELNGIGDGRHAFQILIPDRFVGQGPIHIIEKKTGGVLIGSPVNLTGVPQSKSLEEIDSIFSDLIDADSSQENPEMRCLQSMEGEHYHRISRLISEKSAAEVLSFEVAQLAERMDAQDREIRQLRSLVALQSAVLSAPEQVVTTLPEKADLRADTFISDVKGFFGLEWNRDGAPYRWTGPERAALLDVYVARAQPVILNLVLLKMRSDGKDTQCRILVDGLPITAQVRVSGGYVLYRMNLPPTTRGQKTQVCILSPELFCPRTDNPTSNDTRQLGVAFHRLVMNAASVSGANSGEEAHNG